MPTVGDHGTANGAISTDDGVLTPLFTTEPHAFGKVADIEWIPVDEANPAPGLASRIQHRQCLAIHEAIIRRYGAEGVAGYIRNLWVG